MKRILKVGSKTYNFLKGCWLFVRGSWRAYSIFWKAVGALFLCFLTLAAPVLIYIYLYRSDLPDVKSFINFEAPTIGVIYDKDGRVVIELANEYRRIVRPDEIPPIVKQAIISAEDGAFYSHNGIDKWAIGRAFYVDTFHSIKSTVRKGRPNIAFEQGASTITQQIVRLYFLSDTMANERKDVLISDSFLSKALSKVLGPSRTNRLFRKLEEARIAIWLEKELAKPEYFGSKQTAKEEILARYASYAYLKYGRYGVEAASEFYFDKKIGDFGPDDADKAALLAGTIKNPTAYGPSVKPSKLELQRQVNRRNAVLDLMVENGYILKQDVNNFKQRDLPIVIPGRTKTIAPSVVGDIFKELRRHSQNSDDLFNGKIQIYSTANLKIQDIVNHALESGLKAYEDRHPEAKGLIQGCVIVLRNSDGAILAQSGGRQYFKGHPYKYSDLNRVTYSIRQPGSSFKPLDYITAFENGWTLDQPVMDIPVHVAMGNNRPAKTISNYDGKYKGAIPLRVALAESRNAATVWLVRANGGIDQVIDVAKSLGIKTELQPYITTALGASEVNLLELANVYRSIASGSLAEPYMIERITDRTGRLIFSNKRKEPVPVPVKEGVLQLIQEGLRGVVRLPDGTAHSLDNKDFGVAVMGKTGTTNDFKDAWFIGATYGSEGITVGVKIGFDEPSLGYDESGNFGTGPARGLGNKEAGGRAALPVFREIVKKIYDRKLVGPAPAFPEEIEKSIDIYLGKK
ncbi:MAG: hypothetical protein A2925_02540 [Candidatus Yanofskybacteria bacterium RIFCSPLOWO2_01_FULL_44_22]|uniref:peptidoglycan glycosyltransferase n=2 Tax=Candidatus Yanofskyibacteriota TaxID=1752733 RepID=A0A1F8GKF9_9BACT|nr:MAG: hypothetical protein A2659_01620 [Candidatus Yanofskybacteria bacterium RIFCSPHIGHO2_01_FULL_44_24]OGN25894.1 MAG: hypothetical protein A2925_02540 [Candidatus Yanofskybacteria bacterium RIFCSPLOWO2_01_FULL_44_22]